MADLELLIKTHSQNTESSLSSILDTLGSINGTINGIKGTLEPLAKAAQSVSRAINRLAGDIEKINPDKFEKLSKGLNDVSEQADKASEKMSHIADGVEQSAEKARKPINSLARDLTEALNNSQMNNLSEGFKTLTAEEQAATEQANRLIMSISQGANQAILPMSGIAENISKIGNAVSETTNQFNTLQDTLETPISAGMMSDFNTQLDTSVKEVEELTAALETPVSLENAIDWNKIIDEKDLALYVEQVKSEMEEVSKAVDTPVSLDNLIDWGKIIDEKELNLYVEKIRADMQEIKDETKKTFDTPVSMNIDLDKVIDEQDLSRFVDRTRIAQDAIKALYEKRNEAQKLISAYKSDPFGSGISTDRFNEAVKLQDRLNNEIREYESILKSGNLSEPIDELSRKLTEAATRAKEYKKTMNDMLSGKQTMDTTQFETAKKGYEEAKKYLDDYVKSLEKVEEKKPKIEAPQPKQWSDILAEVEKMNRDFDLMASKIGEANADMQILVDTRNLLKKSLDDTFKGKNGILWDNEAMQKATTMLQEVEDKIARVRKNMADPNKLEVDVTEPINEIEKLYSRLRELNSLISDMKKNKINYSNEDVAKAFKERESVMKRIKEIEGTPAKTPKKDDNLKWMATIIAMQHELEKLSGMFSKMGDIAKNAFLKCLLPLKLVQHQFEEMKSTITHIGSAFAMMFKPIAKAYSSLSALSKKIRETFSVKAVMKSFAATAGKAFDSLLAKWNKVMQRFSFTLLRKAINQIITTLNDAMKSLALFSKGIGTDFNDSMSLITSDFRYLGASITAMLEPLINMFAPILDALVDRLVNVINHVNMFIAALSGAKTFTIAKKKIVDYSKAIEEANKKAKQLTMGIDELNILNDDKSSNELEDMFDWEEVTTPKIDFGFLDGEIWDLIKKIIEQIKQLLKAIWDAIRAAWDRVKDYVLGAIKRLIKAALQLISDILRDLIKLFKEAKTIELLETIMRICGDLINVIAAIIEKIDEAWNHNQLGLKILEKIRDILLVIAKHVQNVTSYMVKWAESLTFIPLFEAFLYLLEKIEYAVDQIGYVFEDLAKLVLDLLKYVIEKALPELLKFQGDIIHGIGNIAKNIHEAWTELNYGKVLFDDITAIVDTLLEHLRNVGHAFDDWTVDLDFKPLMNAFDTLLQSIQPLVDNIGGLIEKALNDIVLPAIEKILEKVAPDILKFISDIVTGFSNIAENINKAWDDLDFGKELFKNLSDMVDILLDHIRDIGRSFKKWGKELNFEPIMKSINNLAESLKPAVDALGGVFEDLVDKVVLPAVKRLIEDELPKLGDAIAKFADAIDWGSFRDRIGEIFEAFDHLEESIGEGVIQFVEDMGQAIAKFGKSKEFQDFLDTLINFMNSISPEMITKVLDGIGMAIIKIAEAVVKFANSDLVQDFLNSLLKFISNAKVERIADIILGIAEGFAAFKGLSMVTGIVSKLMGIVPLFQGLAAVITPQGALVAGIIALVGAFSLFGDTLKSIDWAGILDTIMTGLLDLLNSVNWDTIGEVLASLILACWKISFTRVIPLGIPIALKAFTEIISGVGAVLISTLQSIFEQMGLDVIAGFIGGIKAAWEGIWDFISGLIDAFINFVKDLLGVHSPSTVFAEIGRDLVQGLIDGVTEMWENFIAFFNGAFEAIFEVFRQSWATVHEIFMTAWQAIQDWFTATWEEFKLWCAETWNGIIQAIVDTWNGFIEKIQTVWNEVSEWFSQAWDKFKTWCAETWDKIVDTICETWRGFIEKMETVWGEIKQWFDSIWTEFKQWVSETWNNITTAAADTWRAFKDKVAAIWEEVKKWFETTWENFQRWVKETWEKIVENAVRAWDGFIGKIKEVWNKIRAWFEQTWNDFKQWVGETWKAIVQTIIDAWHGFIGLIGGVWEEIKQWFDQTWNAFKEWAVNTWNGIIEAIIGVWNDFISKINEIWEGVTKFFKELWNEIQGTWEKVWGDIFTALKGIWEDFKTTIGSVWDGIVTTVKGVWDDVVDAWHTVWGGLGEFIGNVINGIVRCAEGLANSVISAVNGVIDVLNSLHVHIPNWVPLFGDKDIGFNLSKISEIKLPKIDIPTFQLGGFPEDGLFMANSGELVGQFSNGRTAVVNNQQIEAGISQAVSSVLAPYLEQIAKNTGIVADKDFTVDIDSREIARANDRGRSSLGRSLTSLS